MLLNNKNKYIMENKEKSYVVGRTERNFELISEKIGKVKMSSFTPPVKYNDINILNLDIVFELNSTKELFEFIENIQKQDFSNFEIKIIELDNNSENIFEFNYKIISIDRVYIFQIENWSYANTTTRTVNFEFKVQILN